MVNSMVEQKANMKKKLFEYEEALKKDQGKTGCIRGREQEAET